jgi:hypothetical protein
MMACANLDDEGQEIFADGCCEVSCLRELVCFEMVSLDGGSMYAHVIRNSPARQGWTHACTALLIYERF